MRKIITIFVLTSLLIHSSGAQYSEIGLLTGISSYLGDLQSNTMPAIGSYGTSGGLLYRYNFSPRLSVSSRVWIARFSCTDAYASGARRTRNLSFRNTLYEIGVHGEWNLTQYDILDDKISAPYLILGVSGFYHNPQARNRNSTWVSLQPFGTEGQTLEGGKKYSLFQFAIPYGIGARLALHQRVNLGVELVFHQTFTDYLDDVSGNYPDLNALRNQSVEAFELSWREPQYFNMTNMEMPSGKKRGDNYKMDIYYFFGTTLTINLGNRKRMEFNSNYRSFWNM